MAINLRLFTIALLLLYHPLACFAAPVEYFVSIDAPQSHYVNVELKIAPKQAGELELFLPVWTPGSYLVREYARNIDSVTAIDSENKPLSCNKLSKNRWKIPVVSTKPITFKYRIYCNELSVRTNFVDAEFGILSGAATFITSPQHLTDEHTVQLKLPVQWKQSVTSLEHPINAPAHNYRAANFDELVDSPILVGNPTLHPFRVGDVEHFLVNQGGDPYWNGEAAAADAAKIVAEHQKMWGMVPYKRYHFFNLIAESGGGLEHNNSTVLLTSRWAFRNDKNYKKWLGLVSHEFFHVWNVRRLRPKALAKYDYQSEVYFDELWVAEGITSYYDELALVRSGLTKPKEYLTILSKQIETLQNMPGRQKQSLVESSYDSWIKYYRPDENSANTSINYYNKGAIAGMLLDIAIRKRTANQKSLDDVMRLMYQRYAEKDGYTNQELASVANEVAGSDLSPWFQRSIYSTEELDYTEALDWLGLQFKAEGPKEGAADAKEEPETDTKDSAVWLGATVDSKEGKYSISRITEGSPAFLAGLNVGDEAIGIDGFRLSEPLDERLKQYKVGDKIVTLVSRRGKLIELSVILMAKPLPTWKLELLKTPTPQQSESFSRWLHKPVSK
jgi:predicted metalloprotease with PDZ domain